jgi:hypothetical protein
MGMNQIINMVIRVIMRKVINSGITAGVGAFSKRGKGRDNAGQPVSKAESAEHKNVQASAAGAKKMARVTRRMTRM